MSVFEHRLLLGAASVPAQMLFLGWIRGYQRQDMFQFLLEASSFARQNLSDWELAQFIFRYERTGTGTHSMSQC